MSERQRQRVPLGVFRISCAVLFAVVGAAVFLEADTAGLGRPQGWLSCNETVVSLMMLVSWQAHCVRAPGIRMVGPESERSTQLYEVAIRTLLIRVSLKPLASSSRPSTFRPLIKSPRG